MKMHRQKWEPPQGSKAPQAIEDQWQHFAATVFPPGFNVHPVQYSETRQAFFAGAIAMFFTVTDSLTHLSDRDAMERLTEYRREIDEYAAAMKARADKEVPR